MADIQNQLEEFHENIKLGRFKENKELRDKRDIITNKVEKGLKKYFDNNDIDTPSIDFIDQGSYAVDTGIKPKDGNYDIDEGVIIGLCKEEYEDNPTIFKEVIEDIMKNHTKIPPKVKKPCVTITYSENEEPTYHVDLPVYLRSSKDDNLYLAWGNKTSKENKEWKLADPEGLNKHIREAFSDNDKRQFKRIVRYLKKWKDNKFASESSDGTPPSIGLTIIAADKLNPVHEINTITGKEVPNDLKAMKYLVDDIKSLFNYEYCCEEKEWLYTIKYNLPVGDESNVFFKMTNKKMNSFYKKVEDLQNAIQFALDEKDPNKACTELVKYFGCDLPIPESTENRYKTVGASSAPSSNFA
ncbi:cyclic GMP-AMP synthase DncV-like nucleotidyltransferase [Romboutsia sp. 1001216sp1]|uniref:cyclic GMP-AMP synthase DncV-like nucleotidyltransferase n=1 Tax=Romboutsia sp. 1001216sp1 TaxID=2986997 RepID=UPI00232C336D|nr:nucleotidyltransferase [Romboutsia sp. 1001216sp1]MDB8803650.1 nucleotidyltransferase [Romboutsia sp. 1001216sp1]MDB8807848.1 nucleotidyltransferase [Romboutsia sp. 1001216sp1]MDB8809297.1 nucleotidyltransferase [Romboutsia sp. 1001216sp1]MDB8815046.1 nucleotidyltransferase [Romboutsia sp. 1001216sp1]MDB8817739.1 nucleotidyltransferase [Romboutsia sp. 1001216sp1]